MRVKSGKTRLRSKKRLFHEAKGNVGGRRRLWRTVQETLVRARAFAWRDRRARKRDFRRLWITRLSAACTERGLKYSEFIHGLSVAGMELDRKTLSELAIREPHIFDEIVSVVKEALAQPKAA